MENVRKKLRTLEMLLGQYDQVVTDVVAARYRMEIAAARPQFNDAVRESTEEMKTEFKLTNWRLEQAGTLIKNLTGLTLEEARELNLSLVAVFNSYLEVKQLLASRTQLNPILEETVRRFPGTDDEEREKNQKTLDRALGDVAEYTFQLARLEQKARELASQVKDISTVALVSPSQTLTSLTQRGNTDTYIMNGTIY